MADGSPAKCRPATKGRSLTWSQETPDNSEFGYNAFGLGTSLCFFGLRWTKISEETNEIRHSFWAWARNFRRDVGGIGRGERRGLLRPWRLSRRMCGAPRAACCCGAPCASCCGGAPGPEGPCRPLTKAHQACQISQLSETFVAARLFE
jgi:hypothetical protein